MVKPVVGACRIIMIAACYIAWRRGDTTKRELSIRLYLPYAAVRRAQDEQSFRIPDLP
jgi:hypothetical protein